MLSDIVIAITKPFTAFCKPQTHAFVSTPNAHMRKPFAVYAYRLTRVANLGGDFFPCGHVGNAHTQNAYNKTFHRNIDAPDFAYA